jgi:hypothetical protein
MKRPEGPIHNAEEGGGGGRMMIILRVQESRGLISINLRSCHLSGGTERNHKTLSQIIRCSRRDLNQKCKEYEAEISRTRLRYSHIIP